MMTAKNSNLRPNLFSDLSNRCPTVAWKLVNDMIECCKQSQKPKSFLLVKSFEIIANILKTTSKLVPEVKTEIGDKIKLFSACVLETLNATDADVKGPYGMPKDRMKSVIKSLAIVIRRFETTFEKEEYQKLWNHTELIASLNRIMETEIYSGNSMKNQITQVINFF
jgi:ribosomal protein S10